MHARVVRPLLLLVGAQRSASAAAREGWRRDLCSLTQLKPREENSPGPAPAERAAGMLARVERFGHSSPQEVVEAATRACVLQQDA